MRNAALSCFVPNCEERNERREANIRNQSFVQTSGIRLRRQATILCLPLERSPHELYTCSLSASMTGQIRLPVRLPLVQDAKKNSPVSKKHNLGKRNAASEPKVPSETLTTLMIFYLFIYLHRRGLILHVVIPGEQGASESCAEISSSRR